MLPTAPNSLTEYALGSLRRHIGQPFGSFDERQAAAWQRARATNCEEQKVDRDANARGR